MNPKFLQKQYPLYKISSGRIGNRKGAVLYNSSFLSLSVNTIDWDHFPIIIQSQCLGAGVILKYLQGQLTIPINPSNAKATFIQSMMTQRFLKTI